MLIQKSNPVGIDYVISQLQKKVYDFLTVKKGFTKYDSYERAYVNPKGTSEIPEVYVGKNEYKEVLFNDKFNITSFFVVDDKRNYDKENARGFIQNVSLIFQCNLKALYPSITHRADEEFNKDAFNALKYAYSGIDINEMITGIDNVYSDFDKTRLEYVDMSSFHIVKLNFDLTYKYCKI